MGRHERPDHNPLLPPKLRVAGSRPRHASDQTMPGVLFPIVDDLSQIAADDQLLDSIAGGRTEFSDLFDVTVPLSPPGSYPTEGFQLSRYPVGSVAPLLATWRSEIVGPPLPALPALAVVKRVMSGPPAKSRQALRHILGVAAAICALLLGSAAVGAHSARPGDALWGLNVVLYSNHAASVKAGVQASANMASAQSLIDRGTHGREVQNLLVSAEGNVADVAPADGQEKLQQDLAHLFTEAARTSASGTTPAVSSSAAGLAVAAEVSLPTTSSTSVTVPSTSASATLTPSTTAPVTSVPVVALTQPPSTTTGAPAPPASVPTATSSGASPVVAVTTSPASTTAPTTTRATTSHPVTTTVTTSHPATGVSATTVPVTVLPVISVPVSIPALTTVPVTSVWFTTVPVTTVMTVTIPVTVPSVSPRSTPTWVLPTSPDAPAKSTPTTTEMSTTSELPTPSTTTSSTGVPDSSSAPTATPSTSTGH